MVQQGLCSYQMTYSGLAVGADTQLTDTQKFLIQIDSLDPGNI